MAIVFGKVLKALTKLVILIGVKIGRDYESSWGGIENLVTAVDCMDVVFIISFKTSDQASFGGYLSIIFKVIDNKLCGCVKFISNGVKSLLRRPKELFLLSKEPMVQY